MIYPAYSEQTFPEMTDVKTLGTICTSKYSFRTLVGSEFGNHKRRSSTPDWKSELEDVMVKASNNPATR